MDLNRKSYLRTEIVHPDSSVEEIMFHKQFVRFIFRNGDMENTIPRGVIPMIGKKLVPKQSSTDGEKVNLTVVSDIRIIDPDCELFSLFHDYFYEQIEEEKAKKKESSAILTECKTMAYSWYLSNFGTKLYFNSAEINALKGIVKKIQDHLPDGTDANSPEVVSGSLEVLLNGLLKLSKDGSFKYFRNGFKMIQVDSNFSTIYHAIREKYGKSEESKSIIEGYIYG